MNAGSGPRCAHCHERPRRARHPDRDGKRVYGPRLCFCSHGEWGWFMKTQLGLDEATVKDVIQHWYDGQP